MPSSAPCDAPPADDRLEQAGTAAHPREPCLSLSAAPGRRLLLRAGAQRDDTAALRVILRQVRSCKLFFRVRYCPTPDPCHLSAIFNKHNFLEHHVTDKMLSSPFKSSGD